MCEAACSMDTISRDDEGAQRDLDLLCPLLGGEYTVQYLNVLVAIVPHIRNLVYLGISNGNFKLHWKSQGWRFHSVPFSFTIHDTHVTIR